MARRIAVIVSQGPGSNPVKRKLEEDIVAGLLIVPGVEVTVVPNLYDLKPDSTGMLALQGFNSDMVVCSWLFERAAHWILDRNRISGMVGTTLLRNEEDEEHDPDELEEAESVEAKPRVIDQRDVPNRRIWCLDLKTTGEARSYIEEISRIHQEINIEVVSLTPSGKPAGPTPEQLDRFDNPRNSTALSRDGNGLAQRSDETTSNGSLSSDAGIPNDESGSVRRIEDASSRRWYPVIDYSRCTNCLECIDFCLFGVYGVDRIDTILVEQPDNCRKGCPACSRVCPENAIIFPQHKTPVIAGSAEVGVSLKIDLSQLFGAPDAGKSAEEIAAIERDEQLLLAGRETVGMQGLERRQNGSKAAARDELDDLVDQLNELDI